MSYARAFSQIDTWITEYSLTANFGLTPVLEVWNKINDRRSDRKEWARMLLKFGLTSLSAGIVSTGKYPDPRTDTTVSAYIYMFNTPSTDTVPENFDIIGQTADQSTAAAQGGAGGGGGAGGY